MNIKIEKLTEDEIQKLGIRNWPVWTKEVSTFDWYYDSTEMCLILEGKVIVKSDSEVVEFGKGDFVTFPKGLKCVWNVIEPVRKHYHFD
ncbi:MAG: cupin domain-containing protein [Ignavibacteriae bacterium]|nr:cupin domain-containing protein [Ignavibacteriota bacterium]